MCRYCSSPRCVVRASAEVRRKALVHLPEDCPEADAVGHNLLGQHFPDLLDYLRLTHGMNFNLRMAMPEMFASIVTTGASRAIPPARSERR